MSYWRDKGVQYAKALESRPKDWSSSEVATVRKMAAQGSSRFEIAEALGGRWSPDCVYRRAVKLGIKFWGNNKRKYGVETSLPKRQLWIDPRHYRPSAPSKEGE